MTTKSIIFFTVGPFDSKCMRILANDVAKIFHLPVTIEPHEIDLSEFFDDKRRQYDGNKLLFAIDQIKTKEYIKKIGLFQVDLYIPILTYIFGQALFKGTAGIVSVYRLKSELYGLEQNPKLQVNRFKKVIIHELGHSFGLIHCQNHECVMRSSTYVEDIDQKGEHFCASCQTQLNQALGR